MSRLGFAEGAQLFEVPVACVEAGFGLQSASSGGVEGLFGAHQHAGQRQLVAEGGFIATDEEHLPAVFDGGGWAQGKDDDVDGDDGIGIEPRLGAPTVGV